MKNLHVLPKETLEEAAEKYWSKQPYNEDAFIEGAKLQQERMYSEEEVIKILWEYVKPQSTSEGILLDGFLEQFKKK